MFLTGLALLGFVCGFTILPSIKTTRAPATSTTSIQLGYNAGTSTRKGKSAVFLSSDGNTGDENGDRDEGMGGGKGKEESDGAGPGPGGRVIPLELNDELKSSFMSYAMSTILGRALPDARDGMKPVHRRVLYAMSALSLDPSSPHRKCARIVGEVLGKFHPHGDQSVYDALVRMAQDFVMLHPLINGHGNFGSVDADPAAAMRYTEAKLSSVVFDSMLMDIKENTVDFQPNFDGTEIEPMVLPAKLPMLLLNGASGIAVGMATNIPPHNLNELADAVIAMIRNPDLPNKDLVQIVPAPDFPTGGLIMGGSGAEKLYLTGHGSITMRAKCHIEQVTSTTKTGTRTRGAIVITELPYMTNKAVLLEKIADMVNDKKLDGISDLRDESDREGIRVVIELKRDAIPALVQNNLFKKTSLQTSFSGNMLALVDDGKQPQRLSLKTLLQTFIDFRFNTVRRRTAYQLKKLEDRDHIVQGLLIALSNIDDIIEVLRGSKDTAAAKVALCEKYALTNVQADAVAALRLGRLTSMEIQGLEKEHEDLLKDIEKRKGIMQNDQEVNKIMIKETEELKKKHGKPRQSQILEENADLSAEDLLANDKSFILVTRAGYIKRLPAEEFEAQSRGGKGKAGTKLSTDEDAVAHFFACNDHDSILFVTDRGVAYSVKAYQVPTASRTAKGVPLPQLLPISTEEEVTSILSVEKFGNDEFLVLLTSQGFVKKTPLGAFEKISARGLTIISLGEKDTLKWTRKLSKSEDVLIATRDGFASRFAADDITTTGRTSRGVRALRLREGDQMADMDLVPASADHAESYILTVTEGGYGKRIPLDEFRTQRRGGKGVIAIKFKEKVQDGDALRCMRLCSPGDELVLSSSKGAVIRQRADNLSVQSRTATGVLIQKMSKEDRIVMIDVVQEPDDDEQLPSSDGPKHLMSPPKTDDATKKHQAPV